MSHSKADSVTLVHDYYDRPGLFSDLERFFTTDPQHDHIRQRGTMAVFRKKSIIDKDELKEMWEKHKHSIND